MSDAPKQQARGSGASGRLDAAPKVRSTGGAGGRNLDDVWEAIQNLQIKMEGMGRDIVWIKWLMGFGMALIIGLLLSE